MRKIDLQTVLVTALVTALMLAVIRAVANKLPAPLSTVAAHL